MPRRLSLYGALGSPSSDEGKGNGEKHFAMTLLNPSCHGFAMKTVQCFLDKAFDPRSQENEKYVLAGTSICNASRHRKQNNLSSDLMDTVRNERYFTGRVVSAINALLGNGFAVVHQECCGSGSAHSDLHGSYRWPDKKKGNGTLLVGERKSDSDNGIRGDINALRPVKSLGNCANCQGKIRIIVFAASGPTRLETR